MCVGEKSCTSLLCIDLLFNKHSIVIIFVYLIVKMHVQFSLDWTINVTLEQRRLYSSTFMRAVQRRKTRSNVPISRWVIGWPFARLLLTFPAACAGFVVVKTCWFLDGSLSVQHLRAVTTWWRLSLRTSIFNLSFLATRINSECNKGKTMNQFFHVVHNAKSAAYSSGCENSGQT